MLYAKATVPLPNRGGKEEEIITLQFPPPMGPGGEGKGVGGGAGAGREEGGVGEQAVVGELEEGGAGDDGPEVVGHVWTDGRVGELGPSHGETRLVEGKRNEHQDPAQGVLSISAAAVSIAEIISGFGWRGSGYALRLWVRPSASMISAVRYDTGPGFKTGTGSRS